MIDDHESSRHLLITCLESLGYTVDEAGESAAALRCIETRIFDMVFVNWTLSDGLRGEHIARHLRSQPAGGRSLVIAVVPGGSAFPAGRPEAADAFLAHPLNQAVVETSIASARRHRAPPTPAAARVLKALQTYAIAFPGGMSGALNHCRDEILSEQRLLREASAAGRWHDAARAAHNLGSLGAMTGLPVLHTTARAAESALRASDTSSIPPALEATWLSVESARATLTGLIG